MLSISPLQMRAFEAALLNRFVHEVLGRLARTCGPSHGWQAEDVLRAVEAARGFGLEEEDQVADFIEISCDHLSPLPALPLTRRNWPVPALAILCSHGLPAHVKVERYRAWASTWDGELP